MKLKVSHIFSKCGIKVTVVETIEGGHAGRLIQVVKNEYIKSFDGIIAVGGDGLFQDIVTGLLTRLGHPNDNSPELLQQIRLGLFLSILSLI